MIALFNDLLSNPNAYVYVLLLVSIIYIGWNKWEAKDLTSNMWMIYFVIVPMYLAVNNSPSLFNKIISLALLVLSWRVLFISWTNCDKFKIAKFVCATTALIVPFYTYFFTNYLVNSNDQDLIGNSNFIMINLILLIQCSALISVIKRKSEK